MGSMKVQPTTSRGQETVERVLDAACVLFARQGIHPTTLDEVGALSGTGRGQLYHFFAGKSDLVAEVIARQCERVLDAQQPLLGNISTAADVRAWCSQAAEQYAQDDDPIRCPIGSLVHELGEQDVVARAALATGFGRWQAALAEGLRRVRDTGELAAGSEPEDVAAALLAAYEGGVLLAGASSNLEVLSRALGTVAATALAPESAA